MIGDFLGLGYTSIVLAEGDGRFTEYAGGYNDMRWLKVLSLATPSRGAKGGFKA